MNYSQLSARRTSLGPALSVCLKVIVTRDDSQRRFLAQHSVATLLRHCFEWLQHCLNIAALCCAKNRRCESSRVTSPLERCLSNREYNKGSKERERQPWQSILQRCPSYRDVCPIEVSVLQRCPFYGGVRLIEVSVLRRCPLRESRLYR